MKQKLYFNWSSGKDSSLAFYELLKQDKFQIDLLFTTIDTKLQRVSMHGLHRNLLVAQAEAIGLSLEILEMPEKPDMKVYNELMAGKTKELKERGYLNTAFGDIFLEDLRKYREAQLKKNGIKAHFPLWKKDTKELMQEFLTLGFKTVIVSANAKWFNTADVGITIDQAWLDNLPKEVDFCGENGEFHTFCYDGPIFKKSVKFKQGKAVLKSYPEPSDSNKTIKFWFRELILQ